MEYYGSDQYMTQTEFDEMMKEAKEGKLNYKRPTFKRLALLADQAGIGLDLVLLYYLVECEQLYKENQQMKKKLSAIQKSAKGTQNPYQVALALGNVKPAYKKEADIETILALAENGYSYEQIAELLGVSKSTIYRRMKEYKENSNLHCADKKIKLDL